MAYISRVLTASVWAQWQGTTSQKSSSRFTNNIRSFGKNIPNKNVSLSCFLPNELSLPLTKVL
jgi:hypothetical protein